jgi:hypothetical protein
MAPKDDALALVSEFETSGRPGVWLNISTGDVVKGLRTRIADPSKINQGGSMLCGPAAFAYDLATTDPKSYAKVIIDLYTGGTGVVGTLLIRVKKDLRNNHFSGGVDPADWILLASLRDESNWLFDVEEVDDLLGVATLPSTVESWLKNVGYTKIINSTNVWFTKDSISLRTASQLLGNGYRIFLFVNSYLLENDTQSKPSLAPNHFCMLLSQVEITGPPMESLQTVSTRVYSWGNEQTVPEKPKNTLTVTDFLLNYYGYIAFKH